MIAVSGYWTVDDSAESRELRDTWRVTPFVEELIRARLRMHGPRVRSPYFFSAAFSLALASARIRSGWSLNRSRQPVQQTQ